MKLRHPPTPTPWSAQQNIPQAFPLQGPPLSFRPVFLNCPSSPLPVSPVIFLLHRCWSDILKCISTLLYSCTWTLQGTPLHLVSNTSSFQANKTLQERPCNHTGLLELDPASGALHRCSLYLWCLLTFHHPLRSARLPHFLVQGSAQVSSDQPIQFCMDTPVTRCHVASLISFMVFISHCLSIYLAAPGHSCSMWDLVPWPGIKPGPLSMGAGSLSH